MACFGKTPFAIWKRNHETANHHPHHCHLLYSRLILEVQPVYQWFTNDALGTVGVGANSTGTLAEGAGGDFFGGANFLQEGIVLRPWILMIWIANIHAINLPQKVYPIWIYEYFVWVWVILTIWWITSHPKSDAFAAFKIRRKFRWLSVVLLYFDRCDYGTCPAAVM